MKKAYFFSFFAALLLSSCAGGLAKSEHGMNTYLCNKGLTSKCAKPGENNVYSEQVNRGLKADVFSGDATSVTKGKFELQMACRGELENIKIIRQNIQNGLIHPCASSLSLDSNPFSIDYCYTQDSSEQHYARMSDYLPDAKACRLLYFAQNESIDELLERNEANLLEFLGENYDELIAKAVLWLPNIKRDESAALAELKYDCEHANRFTMLHTSELNEICNLYKYFLQVDKYLCQKYNFTPSCKAIQ